MAEGETRLLMLIDDEPVQCRLVGALAAREGWRTLVAESAEEALARLDTPEGRQLGAVLLDQWVPGDDACNLIREIKARRPTLPVLMITASTSPLPDQRDSGTHEREARRLTRVVGLGEVARALVQGEERHRSAPIALARRLASALSVALTPGGSGPACQTRKGRPGPPAVLALSEEVQRTAGKTASSKV